MQITSDRVIIDRLRAVKGDVRDRFHVKKIGVFGSTVKGQRRPDSDVDILVEFSSPVSIFTFVHLREYVSERLGVRVDLVTEGGLHPLLKERIMGEVVYVRSTRSSPVPL